MKKIFTLSMVMLAAASLSAQSLDVTSANSRQLNAQPKANIQREAPVQFEQAINPVAAPFAATLENGARKAPASAVKGAHYTPNNMLKIGVFYSEENQAFGYSYNLPYLFGQAYWGSYTPNKGGNWTIGTNDSPCDEYVDADGNFSIATAQMGVGGFYTPKIWSKDGKYAYFYGADDADAPAYSVFFGGTGEEMELNVYTLYANATFYTGYSNTPGFGSRDFESSNTGNHIQADRVLVDYGYQKGLVVNKVRMPLGTLSNVPDGPIAEGKEVDVYLSVVAEDGEEAIYHGVMTSENVFVSGSWYIADVVFTEEDEDGFSAEVSPVCNGEVSLLMTGFMQEGVQCEIPMVYYEDEDNSDYVPTSYWDQWVDGVQDVDDNGNVAYYTNGVIDAAVSLVGYYNFLGELGTGETVFNATAPAAGEGGYSWAVSAVQEGQAYNDFDLESTFAFDEWDFEFDDEVVAGFDVDSSYLEQYGCYLLYVAVKDLPAGVEERTTTVKVTSGETATVTINIAQGVAGENGIAGLKGEAVEPKQIYNLMGQKVLNANAAGLYIQDGKKTLVK